eukprot:354803-Chlamydomonas_euryale.AAC.4
MCGISHTPLSAGAGGEAGDGQRVWPDGALLTEAGAARRSFGHVRLVQPRSFGISLGHSQGHASGPHMRSRKQHATRRAALVMIDALLLAQPSS